MKIKRQVDGSFEFLFETDATNGTYKFLTEIDGFRRKYGQKKLSRDRTKLFLTEYYEKNESVSTSQNIHIEASFLGNKAQEATVRIPFNVEKIKGNQLPSITTKLSKGELKVLSIGVFNNKIVKLSQSDVNRGQYKYVHTYGKLRFGITKKRNHYKSILLIGKISNRAIPHGKSLSEILQLYAKDIIVRSGNKLACAFDNSRSAQFTYFAFYGRLKNFRFGLRQIKKIELCYFSSRVQSKKLYRFSNVSLGLPAELQGKKLPSATVDGVTFKLLEFKKVGGQFRLTVATKYSDALSSSSRLTVDIDGFKYKKHHEGKVISGISVITRYFKAIKTNYPKRANIKITLYTRDYKKTDLKTSFIVPSREQRLNKTIKNQDVVIKLKKAMIFNTPKEFKTYTKRGKTPEKTYKLGKKQSINIKRVRDIIIMFCSLERLLQRIKRHFKLLKSLGID